MKNRFLLFFSLLIVQDAFSRNFKFRLTNTTSVQIQVSVQLIKGVEKESPVFLFVINPTESKDFKFKVRRKEKLKFIGAGGGVETLPLIKSFDILQRDSVNSYNLVVPVLDKLNVLELNDVIAKLKNDNILKVLVDSVKYGKDDMPPLGTFLFVNTKTNSILPLPASYWKNENLIRKINNQYFSTSNFINSSNASSLGVSGVPFLRGLSTSFSNSNVMEVIWDIQNAHIEQWQPNDKTVYQILQDPINDSFIKSCVEEMKAKNLGGGDYQLLFISSAYVVDKIKIIGRKYNAVNFSADVDFQFPPSGVEVVQPIGASISYKYTRVKTYSNIDSSSNNYLKYLAQDYTPALNSYLSGQERQKQRTDAQSKADKIKNIILQQYATLQVIDSSLITSKDIDVIIPIASSTINLLLKAPVVDSTNKDITPEIDVIFNRKAGQFNAVLTSLKQNILTYKLTLESIDKLVEDEQTDYQKVSNQTNIIEIDKKIVDLYAEKNKILSKGK